jgi:hypothetical protein
MSTSSYNEFDMFRGAWAKRVTGGEGPQSPAMFPLRPALSMALGLTYQ